jgi:hypothetical protein
MRILPFLALGLSISACSGASTEPAATAVDATPSVDVAAIRAAVELQALSDEERVWEHIPWTHTLPEARVVSTETGRPIFLFSMWGELDGRC